MNSTTFGRAAIYVALAIAGGVLIHVANGEATGAANGDPHAQAVSSGDVFSNLLACELPGLQEREIGEGAHSVVYAGEFSPVKQQQLSSANSRIYLYVVSGKGVVRIDNRSINAAAGDFFVFPRGVRHAVNADGGTLRAIYFEDQS